MTFGLYKWPQGRVVRYIAAAVVLSFVGYAAYKFYVWQSDWIPRWMSGVRVGNLGLSVGVIGAVVLAMLGCFGAYMLAFANAKVGEYLIAVEGELRKVYWPKMKPWFSRQTELWGSTYVVIAVVVILSLFIFLADLGLKYSVGLIFG
ncbi:MAG TPA: preprotein translocase subunit SecE [Planctomycetota bacterium]|nr:preprotein translocase subunit SecE [Planctomycetota bacterium]